MGNREKGSQDKAIVGYSIGNMGVTICIMMINTFLLYYLTDVAGFAVMSASVVLMLGRLWDIANDPLVGVLIDRYHCARKLLLISALPLSVSLLLLFSVGSANVLSSWFLVYAGIFVFILANTCADLSISTLAINHCKSRGEFEKLNAVKMTFSLVGAILVTSVMLPLVSALGQGNEREGYFYATLLMSCVVIVCLIIAYMISKDSRPGKAAQKMKLSDYWSAAKGDRNWFILVAAMLFMWVGTTWRSQIVLYYLKYYVGRIEYMSLLMFVAYSLNALLMIAAPRICKRFGVLRPIFAGLALSAAGQVIIYACGSNLFWLLVGNTLLNGFIALPSSLIYVLATTVVGRGQEKTGKNMTGFVSSTLSLSAKVGMIVGNLVSGLFLQISGYVSGSESQSGAFIQSLQPAYALVSMICFILIAALYAFYRKSDLNCFPKNAES